jgi:DME family drug/metabolite transporter
MKVSRSFERVAAPSRVVEAFGLLILAGVVWGTTGVASRQLADDGSLAPLAIAWWRCVLATPLCLALGWLAHGRALMRVGRRDLALMALLGVVVMVSQWLYVAAIERLDIPVATLISICGAPAIIALASVAVLGEPLTRQTAAALVGALIGTALLVGPDVDGGTGRSRDLGGLALAAGAAVAIALLTLLGRRLAGRQPTWRPLAVGFPVGALAFLPVAAGSRTDLSVPAYGWPLLLYLAAGPSVLAFWLYQRALRNVPATTASIVVLVEPLVAGLLAWALFDERLGTGGIAGGALLLGSIWWLMRPEPARDMHSPAA